MTDARRDAERLVVYYTVAASVGGLAADVARRTGMEWRDVRDGLVDAITRDVETMLRGSNGNH